MHPLIAALSNLAVALGAWWLAAHALRRTGARDRLLAAAVLGWAWITLGVELLGSLASLAAGPLLVWSGVAFGAGLWARRRDRAWRPAGPAPSPADAWDLAAIVALGLVLAAAIPLGVTSLLGPVKVVSDGPIYHLWFAARWWKEGRLSLVPVPFGEGAATYFPANGDLWFAWLMVGWGGDRLAKVGQAPFLLMAGVAAWSLARRLGASASAAVVAACWFVTSTPLLVFSFEPNVDTIFVAGYATSAYFLACHVLERDPVNLALGALAAGLAWGTKPTGTVFVPPLLTLVALAGLLRHGRRFAWDLPALALLPLVTSGYWFGRNLWLTGNPLYPLDLSALGWTGWYGPGAMMRSPYYLPRHDLGALADILLAVVDPRLAPVWLAALVAGPALAAGREARRGLAACSALAILNVALYWVLIPYRTQQRFVLQAVGLAAVPLAVLLDRGILLRLAATALLGLHVLTRQTWPFVADSGVEPLWDFSTVVPNAIGPPLSLGGDRGQVLAVAVLAAGALTVAWLWGRAARRPEPRRLVAALVATVALAAGWGVREHARGFPPSPYPLFADYYRGWVELDQRTRPRGSRIAYAGTNIPYYLMGPNFRNDVRYVPINAQPEWLLHDHHRLAVTAGEPHWPDPRPGWDRQRPDYDAWLANLRAAGIQLLVVTRVNPGEGAHNVADAEGFPIERVWADAHPEHFVPLYGVREGDPRFRLYRVVAGGG